MNEILLLLTVHFTLYTLTCQNGMLKTKGILDAHIKFFTMLFVILPIQPKKGFAA